MSYYEFPHTRTYEGDLGYIIKKLMELTNNYNTFFQYNSIKFADPIAWDITKQYTAYTIVFDFDNNVSMISKQPVPAGIDISNVDYWSLVGPLLVDGDARIEIDRILHFISNIYESGTTATAARNVGEYVMVGGQLYITTSAINVGETYTSGINVTPTTVENMVNAVAADLAAEITNRTNADNKILKSLLISYESGSTASSNKSIGDYVAVFGSVYVVTAAISAGDTYVPGTNISLSTIENIINNVKNALSTETTNRINGDTAITNRLNKATDNRTVEFVGCILRNTGSGWAFINDSDHKPMNVQSVAVNGDGDLEIQLGFNSPKIASVVANCDETFAGDYLVGCRVFTNRIVVRIYKNPIVISGYVYWDGATWNTDYSNGIDSVEFRSDGELRINHMNFNDLGIDQKYTYGLSVDGRGINAQPAGCEQWNLKIKFYDTSGNVITTPNTDMKVFFTRTTQTLHVDANYVSNILGNIWVLGIVDAPTP